MPDNSENPKEELTACLKGMQILLEWQNDLVRKALEQTRRLKPSPKPPGGKKGKR